MSRATAIVLLAGLAAAGAALAQHPVTSQPVASGLTNPVFMTAPPGDLSRLFIVEQRGSAGVGNRGDIKILNLGTGLVNATPFLSVTGLGTSSEQGLLGLAFDPDYDTNGYFYVNYTLSGGNGTTRIVRYQVSANPDVANAASATILLSQPQPFTNHNGGWLGFGPDGYLYIATGDGGSACDPQRNAQSLVLTNANGRLGKILRIDVSTVPYSIPPTNPFSGSATNWPEVWAWGLRNPWRPSFDRQTGDLWIADVGQDAREEVNIQPAGAAGRNYGWHCREGTLCASASGCSTSGCQASCGTAGYTAPIHDYAHASNPYCGAGTTSSITGGYVYRGCAMPELRGTYFFADYCQAQVWSLRYSGGVVTELTNRTTQVHPTGAAAFPYITSFGEDGLGEMYFCVSGTVYRIVPRCRANCDSSTQAPFLNVADFGCFITRYGAQDCYANCDGSTQAPVLNVADFGCFLTKFAAGCPAP